MKVLVANLGSTLASGGGRDLLRREVEAEQYCVHPTLRNNLWRVVPEIDHRNYSENSLT